MKSFENNNIINILLLFNNNNNLICLLNYLINIYSMDRYLIIIIIYPSFKSFNQYLSFLIINQYFPQERGSGRGGADETPRGLGAPSLCPV